MRAGRFIHIASVKTLQEVQTNVKVRKQEYSFQWESWLRIGLCNVRAY